jgi:hypothetical protein
MLITGHAVAWLRHCATSREVAGSNPDEMDFFFPIYLKGKGVKGGCRIRLTTLPPSVSRLSRENVGASMSYNPVGLHSLLQG